MTAAPYIAGSGEGQNVTFLNVVIRAHTPPGESVMVVVTDAYGYGVSVSEISDSKNSGWSTLFSHNEYNYDGSIYGYLATPDDGFLVNDTISITASGSWREFQVEVIALGAVAAAGNSDTVGMYQTANLSVTPASASRVIGITGVGDLYTGVGANTAGPLIDIINDEKPNQGTIVGYYDCIADEKVDWSVTTAVNGYGIAILIPFVLTPPILSIPVDDRFGTPSLKRLTVRLSGSVDDNFGTATVRRLKISLSGTVDDRWGLPTLSRVFVAVPDESFGVAQVIRGDLSLYYGPAPTPLIADAPYSQVYGVGGAEGLVEHQSGLLVPEQRIAAPSPEGVRSMTDKLVVPPYSVPDMGFSRYKFVITDPLGNVQGEVLQCQQKTVTQILDNMSTASFTVYLNNPMIDYILANDCLCKVYRQPVDRRFAYRLMLVGDVAVDEEATSGDTGTMTFSVVDPLNRLMYRLIGKEFNSQTNHGKGFFTGTATDPKDIADTIGAMLVEVNTDSMLGHTGVTLGIRGPNTPNTWMVPVFFTKFTDQLSLYTNTVAGVDFMLEPQEPYSLTQYPPHPGTNPYQPGGPDPSTPPQLIVKGTSVADTCIAKMNIYAPMGNYQQKLGPPGTYSKGRPYPVFEYGTGKHNVQGYQRMRSRASPINMWWNLPSGYPDSNSVADALIHTDLDLTTGTGTVQQQIYRRGGYEDIDSGDLGQNAGKLRQQLVNSEALTTANPQQQITFTPVIDCDEDWTIDYFIGDVVTVRAYVKEANNGAGAWRFNGTMRIYGISATVDENDLEQISITTVDPASSGISAPSGI